MKKIAKYKDLKDILVKEINEKYVLANTYDHSIIMKPSKEDEESFYDGNKIIVREIIAKKLAKVVKRIQETNKDYTLLLDYGYRNINTQKKYFEKRYREIQEKNPDIKDKEVLREMTHKYIAIPEVAGHPTGGAVDLTIFDREKNKEIDMGGRIHDFSSDKLPTFSNGLTKEQEDNRKLLLEVMVEQKFAPFYEEWWHFSYGDREWAFFYEKKYALYGQSFAPEILK